MPVSKKNRLSLQGVDLRSLANALEILKNYYITVDEQSETEIKPVYILNPLTGKPFKPATVDDIDTTGIGAADILVPAMGIVGYEDVTLPGIAHVDTLVFGRNLRSRDTSGANASLQHSYFLRNLTQVLSIVSVASGGTSTLLIEASADNTNWLTIDSIAAALSNVKSYILAHNDLGGTTAVSPLSFPYLRVTAGAAGVGNTVTVTVVAK